MECATQLVEDEVFKKEEKQEYEEDHNRRKMLLGEAQDCREARNNMIDAVERALEFEAFENGEMHMDRGLDRVKEDGEYPLREDPRWMM